MKSSVETVGAILRRPPGAGPDFLYCDFVPTESGLTYSSSNQRSDSDVIRMVGRMR